MRAAEFMAEVCRDFAFLMPSAPELTRSLPDALICSRIFWAPVFYSFQAGCVRALADSRPKPSTITRSIRPGLSALLFEESDHADSAEFLDIAIPPGRKPRGERRFPQGCRDNPQGIAGWNS